MPAVRILVLSPGYPLDGDLYGHAVAEQLGVLGRRHQIVVQSLSARPSLPSTWRPAPAGHSRGLPVHGPWPGGRAVRLMGTWAHHRSAHFDLIWSLWIDRSGPAARWLSRALGVPFVATVMGGELADLPALGYGGARTAAGRRRVQGVLRAAAVVTVGCRGLAERAQQLSPGLRPHIAPFGVAPGPPGPQRRPWWPGTPLSLATVTDCAPVKGADRVFGALRRLREQQVQADLTVYTLAPAAGRAQLAAQARAHGVEGWVHLSPALEAEAMKAALHEAHVLVSASAHESQGLAMIEAAMAGLPVVGPGVGVMPRLAQWGAGELTSDAHPASLASAALRAAASVPTGRPQVCAFFDREVCAGRFEQAFEAAGR